MSVQTGKDQAPCARDTCTRQADCLTCPIRSSMLFAKLDVVQAAGLLEAVSNSNYQPGEIIYRQGDQPAALYSVLKGIIKLSLLSPEGDIRIVRLLGPGAVIGLEAEQNIPYRHTASPISDANVCRLPADNIRQITLEQPALYQSLIQKWTDHSEYADQHVTKLSTGVISDRVLWLLHLLDHLSAKSNSSLRLPSNQDCADIIGARIESVSRTMAQLKRTGVLSGSDDGGWIFNSTLKHKHS